MWLTPGLLHEYRCEHLGRWVGPFTRAMGAAAHTVYYRELADLTASFVDLEMRGADLR